MFYTSCHTKSTGRLQTFAFDKYVLATYIIILFLVVLVGSAFGQEEWNVFQYEAKIGSQISLIPPHTYKEKGYTFFGISSQLTENVITTGFQPFYKDSLWKIALHNTLSGYERYLSFNVYTQNIRTLTMRVYGGDGTCYAKKISFNNNGYQVPFDWELDKSSMVLNQEHPRSISDPDSCIFTASLTVTDTTLPYKLVLGEAKSYDVKYERTPCRGYFFYEVTRNKENKLSACVRRKFGDSYPFKRKTDFISYHDASFNFELRKGTVDSASEQKSTLKLIRYIFTKYPYYKEHDLSKEQTLSSIDEIITDTASFSEKIELLKQKASELHDGHFYFQKTTQDASEISSPLILKQINQEVQVVGIRDNRLDSLVELGSRVYKIDNVSCARFIDSASDFYFGDTTERRELAISHLLERQVNSPPCNITLINSNGKLCKIELSYEKKYPAPNKFKPEHFGFHRIDNDWVYLKLNKWDKGDWIRFYNLRDSLKTSSGIVFDLRGNPGGYETEAIRIASCFLKKSFLYSVQTYSTDKRTYSGQTIVTPNRYLNLAGKRIIILVDNKTTCASESFVLALKKETGAVVIGSSKTGSSFSTVYPLQLPENITMETNILGKAFFLDKKQIIEYAGVVPDIIVDIKKYTDLYGYNDKVLATAKQIIDRSIGSLNVKF